MPWIVSQLAGLAGAMRTRPVVEKTSITVKANDCPEVRVTEIYDLLVSEVIARRARGESFAAIAADLNRRGVRGRHGARFYTSSVRALLISAHQSR